MLRYSGLSSFTPISEALTELNAIGWLRRPPVERMENSPERKTGVYVLTPLSERLMEYAQALASQFGATIYQDKQIRKRERWERHRRRLHP